MVKNIEPDYGIPSLQNFVTLTSYPALAILIQRKMFIGKCMAPSWRWGGREEGETEKMEDGMERGV